MVPVPCTFTVMGVHSPLLAEQMFNILVPEALPLMVSVFPMSTVDTPVPLSTRTVYGVAPPDNVITPEPPCPTLIEDWLTFGRIMDVCDVPTLTLRTWHAPVDEEQTVIADVPDCAPVILSVFPERLAVVPF